MGMLRLIAASLGGRAVACAYRRSSMAPPVRGHGAAVGTGRGRHTPVWGSARPVKATECPRACAARGEHHAGMRQPGGSARLKRLAGRSRIQVNRLEAAVATQNMKNPKV